MMPGLVPMFVMYLVLLIVVCFLSLGVGLCIVSLCSGCDGWCAYCLICDACSVRCFSSSIFVLLCRCCVFVDG